MGRCRHRKRDGKIPAATYLYCEWRGLRGSRRGHGRGRQGLSGCYHAYARNGRRGRNYTGRQYLWRKGDRRKRTGAHGDCGRRRAVYLRKKRLSGSVCFWDSADPGRQTCCGKRADAGGGLCSGEEGWGGEGGRGFLYKKAWNRDREYREYFPPAAGIDWRRRFCSGGRAYKTSGRNYETGVLWKRKERASPD